ncbi:PstS family phosphate ABC transporter substrate-binding protein [Holophaga foetida]|uniref:PstS family phosphate ABC transporter substrate-binding protein n=1 Tax=Holophaga foetida TaxID=35839 RepID=UPI0002474614|nr:substrate-binding domain-containing protein [Holophaga foetida]
MRYTRLLIALLGVLLGLGQARPTLAAQEPAAIAPIDAQAISMAEFMEPLFIAWRDTFQRQQQPTFKGAHRAIMNSKVIRAFLEGTAPIGLCDKEMTNEEIAEFTAKWGYPPTRIAVAMDALVALTNKNNPIKEIRLEQLDAIYSTTRFQGSHKDVATWGDLGLTGGNWASRPIERWGHPEGSGTGAFFRETVELEGRNKPGTKHGEDIMTMIESLMANQAAIGYSSMCQAYSSLKAIPLVPKGGKEAVEATPATVADGSYPLGRVLYIYVNKPLRKPMIPMFKWFLLFALSPEGQKLVSTCGFVPLPEDLVTLGLRRLEN